MAFVHGKNTKVLANASDLSAYFNEASVNNTVEAAETTAFGKTAKTYITGLLDTTVSLGGLFDAGTGTVDTVLAALLGVDGNDVELTVAPEGLAVGKRVFVGGGILTAYEVSAPVSDVVTVSAEFQGDDGIRPGVSLHALAGETATANGASVNNSAATTRGGFGVLHVTANTRDAGSIVVKIQDSADNSTFADIITFTSVAAAATTSEQVKLATTATVRQYVRAIWTVTGGTTGSYTFTVGLTRQS